MNKEKKKKIKDTLSSNFTSIYDLYFLYCSYNRSWISKNIFNIPVDYAPFMKINRECLWQSSLAKGDDQQCFSEEHCGLSPLTCKDDL